MATIIYSSVENGNIVMFPFGDLYLSPDLSRIAITKYVSEDSDPNSKGWIADDGFMLAGPASDREGTLAVSNELLMPILQGFILK